jgi:hypothetical protein
VAYGNVGIAKKQDAGLGGRCAANPAVLLLLCNCFVGCCTAGAFPRFKLAGQPFLLRQFAGWVLPHFPDLAIHTFFV